jgi:ribosomal protein S12 methylthiotransferase
MLFIRKNMKKIALQNLGCSKNQIDGERILNLFRNAGYELTNNPTDADCIIVNTCAFIQEAQQEAIDTILESAQFKQTGKCKKLVVSGCFSERFRESAIKEIPEVDLWAGVNDWEQILKDDLQISGVSSFHRELSEPFATQYLKIAEGCSHNCTFCVIPSIRGHFKSRSSESILEEALWLYEKGTRELIVVAQDTSFYGRDIGSSLQRLLELLLRKTRFNWIRMMYLHPKFIDDGLLTLVGNEQRICSYFDVPLQHISEPILKSMNRTPLTSDIHKLVERIRTRVPDSTIRSSFILGFPGETEKDFRALQKFIEFARFDKLGVFPYSPENGTKAAEMSKRPRQSTAVKRCEELMLQQREISREILEMKIGSKIEVIIENVAEDPDFNFEARSRGDAPEIDGKVMITNGSFTPGSFAELLVTAANDYDLYAAPVPEP